MDRFFTSGLQLFAQLEEAGAEHVEKAPEAHHGAGPIGLLIYFVAILAALFVLMHFAKKGINTRFFTNRITQWFEQLYLFIRNLCTGIIGHHGEKYIPMVMSFWMIIFAGNIVALFFPTSITANMSFNLAMALIAIGYVQWEGMRANGVGGHFKHFLGPKLGGILVVINLMIFVIELVSEAMKNVSLTLRLYGNIDGGHRAASAMNDLGHHLFNQDWLNIPFGAFLIPIKLLTCVVQAMIFCLLFCVYLSLVTHHEIEEAHDHDIHGHVEPLHA
jgi:F-type H+-transporting ATPase subunit a